MWINRQIKEVFLTPTQKRLHPLLSFAYFPDYIVISSVVNKDKLLTFW